MDPSHSSPSGQPSGSWPGTQAPEPTPWPSAPRPQSPPTAEPAGTPPGGVPAPGGGPSQGGSPPGPTPWSGSWAPPDAPGPPPLARPAGPPSEPFTGRSSDLPPAPPPPPDRFAGAAPPVGRAQPSGRRPSPWGWRALVAFLAGGLLVGTGFGVAQLDDDTATTAAVRRPSATAPTGTVPPSPEPGAEPVADVARSLGPAVVQIETGVGLGSGVIYSPDGYILTNNHVVAGSTEVRIRLSDGSRLAGQVLGSDPVVDIAVVKVLPDADLPVAELAVGVPVQVGQLAVAIGSPFELQQTVTSGIVSAVNRPVPNGNGIVAMIQTDAPINPGNSGGALADRYGRVIGINTSIRTETGTNAGIGFAVPIDTAVDTAQRIIDGEPLDQAFLGVAGQEPPTGESGVLVTEVTPGSAAEAAGVQVGDRITAFDGQPVTDLFGLAALVRSKRPGEEINLELVREDQELELSTQLGTQSTPPGG